MARCRAIFKFFARIGLKRACFGVTRNIFPAIQKQHPRGVGIENLNITFSHFGVVEA